MEDNRLTIKSWAVEDRPREKLLLKGKSSLSDAELIAILIGSGNQQQTAVELSQHILNQCDNNLASLSRRSIKDLQKFKGIGEAKAVTIAAALEIGRRRKEFEPDKQFKISSSKDVYDLLNGVFMDLTVEEFWVIYMKRNNEVINKEMLSRGGVSGTVVDAKIIFKRAIEETASGIILAHNHPSGNLKPSHEDISLTKRLKEAGQTLDIQLLDHLIFTDSAYCSLSDEGII